MNFDVERPDVLMYLRRRRIAHWIDLQETKHKSDRSYLERKIAALDEVCDMLRDEEYEYANK